MTETKEPGLGGAALVTLPIVCCVGLSLLVGAGLSVAAAVWIGGLALGTAALAAALALIVARMRRQDAVSARSRERSEPHGH